MRIKENKNFNKNREPTNRLSMERKPSRYYASNAQLCFAKSHSNESRTRNIRVLANISIHIKKESINGSFLISGRRDSNSRQPAWKADALPTELLPHVYFAHVIYLTIKYIQNQEFYNYLN